MRYPEAAEFLIESFRQLPGVGRRGAERMVLQLLNWDPEDQRRFGLAVAKLPETLGHCPRCGGLAARDQICDICADARRDDSLLCVVEDMPQLLAVEKGMAYRGRYLVLGGRLSPLDGEDGSHLNLELLRSRAASGDVKEIILALGSDVEGRATSAYLAEMLGDLNLRITRPALGLPAGANLSFADGATISAAFSARREID